MGAPDIEKLSALELIHILERHTRTILVNEGCDNEIAALLDLLMTQHPGFPRPRVVTVKAPMNVQPHVVCYQCAVIRDTHV